jgi:phage terminase large subunit
MFDASTFLDDWAERIERWKPDPVRFVWDVFGAEPWKAQRQIMYDVVEHDRVAVRSGHGIGKSAVFSWIAWWQLICYDYSLIACTAPTAHQLYDILWAEMTRWGRAMPEWLRAQFKMTDDRVYMVDAKEDWFAVARTARKEQPESLAGFHVNRRHRLLILMEEASGIPEPVYEVLEGAMSTDGCRALMMGNPTRPSGYFFDTFKTNRELWRCHRVSCLDAPPRIVSPNYAKGIAARYGADSNIYRVRVLGEFPQAEDDAVIPLPWAEAALERDYEDGRFITSPFEVSLQLDVARFGSDDTALTVRQGGEVIGIFVWHGNDTVESANKVEMIARRIHAHSQEVEDGRVVRPAYYPTIFVDAVGVGAGVADTLRHIEDSDGTRLFRVVDVGAGEAPSKAEADKYLRRRDELWMSARDFFQFANPVIAPPAKGEEGSLLNWTPLRPRIDSELRQRLTAELATPKYSVKKSGKIEVESKEEVKKRLGGEGARSPDVADSLNLSFYQNPPEKPAKITGTRWMQRQEEQSVTNILEA